MQRLGNLIQHPLTIFALVGAACVAGCARPVVAPVNSKPFAGKTIRAAAPEGPGKLILDRQGQGWARQQGATLVVTAWRDGDPVPTDCDILAFNPANTGRLIADGKLAPLPESVTSGGSWTMLSRPFQTKLLGWGSSTYALPLLGDATILLYRADLLAAAKRKPPETFAAYFELARQFADERKQPSLPPLNNDDALDREFFTVAAAFAVTPLTDSELKNRSANDPTVMKAYGFHFDIDTGKPRLTEPGFVQALQWLIATQPLRSPDKSLVDAMRNDHAVLGLASLTDAAALNPGEHRGRYGVANIPLAPGGETIPYFGPAGVIAAVTKSATCPDAALALLRHLSDLPSSLENIHTPEYGAAPYRAAHLTERADGWLNWGFDRAGTDALRTALGKVTEPRVLNAPIRLRVRDEAMYRKLLFDGICDALAKNTDSAKAMQGIAEQWEKVDARPADEKRDEYLRSLNLKR